MLLRGLLYFQLLYVVNQIHFPWETGIPALAPTNLIFLLVLLALRGEPADTIQPKPFLEKPLLYFYGALCFAFLWAQVRQLRDIVDDMTYLKNALFFPLFYFMYLRCKQDEKGTPGSRRSARASTTASASTTRSAAPPGRSASIGTTPTAPASSTGCSRRCSSGWRSSCAARSSGGSRRSAGSC
jgi:hypothetical protein